MTKVMLCAALLAAAACGDDGKSSLPDAPHIADAHGSDATSPEASVQTKTIDGTATYHYVSEANPDEQVTPDLTGDFFYGYSLENGVWVSRGGTSGTGTFSFPVDQDATSWLWSVAFGQGGPFAQESTSDAPDLSQYFLGRSDTTYPMTDTETTLALSNMSAWVPGDQIELVMPGNGGLGFAIDQYPLTEPNEADTSIDNTFDWEDLDVPLLDAAQNDYAYFLHITQVSDGGLSYTALTEMASISDVTQTDGSPSTLEGSFQAFDRTSTYAVDWHGVAFDALRSAVGAPADATVSTVIAIDALPQADEHGYYSGAPDLVLWYGGDATDQTGTFSYVDPFTFGKGHWDDYVIYQYEWGVSVPDGQGNTATFDAGIFGYDSIDNLTSIAPTLTPPTAVTMNGADAQGTAVVTGATTTPTFAWAAPATGTPTEYDVTIYGVVSFSGFSFVQAAGIYHLTDTKLTVPDGVLTAGQSYIAEISAVHANIDYGTAPFLDALGYLRADAVTAPFTP